MSTSRLEAFEFDINLVPGRGKLSLMSADGSSLVDLEIQVVGSRFSSSRTQVGPRAASLPISCASTMQDARGEIR